MQCRPGRLGRWHSTRRVSVTVRQLVQVGRQAPAGSLGFARRGTGRARSVGRPALYAYVVAMTLLGAACSVAGTGSVASHDLDSLFGIYSPVPRTDLATPPMLSTATQLEARRIAAVVAPPTFADPAFAVVRRDDRTHELASASAMNAAFSADQARAADRGGFITGFAAFRATAADEQAALGVAVLEFPSADKAQRAADEMTFLSRDPHSSRVTVAGFPAAAGWTGPTPNGHYRRTRVYSASNALVVYAETQDAAPAATQIDRIRRLLMVETVALKGFRTNTVADIMRLPVDPTGLLAHTVSSSHGGGVLDEDAVFTGMGPLHWSPEPAADRDILNRAGADEVSTGRTEVFRARDAAGATAIRDAFAPGSTPMASLAPDARCVPIVDYVYCVATRGRFMIQVSGPLRDDVRQAMNAQYVLLAGM